MVNVGIVIMFELYVLDDYWSIGQRALNVEYWTKKSIGHSKMVGRWTN